MPRLDIAVNGLFATPVAALELPLPATLNPALRTAILQRHTETPSIQPSNAGGWHSDREILAVARGVADWMTAAVTRRVLLFLFPSWLRHQVRRYRGNELCISIAFNLCV